MRCGQCAGCHAINCGTCRFCKDMPQFGGRGIMRQSCEKRKCEVIAAEEEVKAEERRVEREAADKVRQAEREARQAEREARQAARGPRQSNRDRQTMADRLTSTAVQKAGARFPTVKLEPKMTGGWGAFVTPAGTRVEAVLDEEGLSDTYWAGRVVEEGGDDAAGKVLVEVDELLDDSAADSAGKGGASSTTPARVTEWLKGSAVRLQPPSQFPRGALELVRPGDTVELLFEVPAHACARRANGCSSAAVVPLSCTPALCLRRARWRATPCVACPRRLVRSTGALDWCAGLVVGGGGGRGPLEGGSHRGFSRGVQGRARGQGQEG